MPSLPELALEWLDRIKGHKVTVLGDDIVDEYIHVRPAGKSAKDNLVTFISDGRQRWAGGARIISQHLEALGCEAILYTSSQAIVKTRYIETAFNQKVFSVCDSDHLPDTGKTPLHSKHLLIADFGHRFGILPVGGDFTSLMVQSNSLNWGFNLLTKYGHADYVVCDEAELRLACQHNREPIEDLMATLARRMKVQLLAVTLGHQGAKIYVGIRPQMPYDDCLYTFPAYAHKVVDRLGAGDAFLAASAPLAAMGAPAQVVGLVGSLAAGLHVEKEGNPPLGRLEVEARLRELLA